MLMLKARQTLKRSFQGKKKSARGRRSSFVLWEAMWWSCCAIKSMVIIQQCWWEAHRRQNIAWVIWIKLFFHIWVGGRRKGEKKQSAGGRHLYWLLVVIGHRHWLTAGNVFFMLIAVKTAPVPSHYCATEEVKTLFTLWPAATHATVVKNSRK